MVTNLARGRSTDKPKVVLAFEERGNWIARHGGDFDARAIGRSLVSLAEIESVSRQLRTSGHETEVLELSDLTRQALARKIHAFEANEILWNLSDGHQRFYGSLVPAFRPPVLASGKQYSRVSRTDPS